MATPKRRISHARTHNRKAKFLGALTVPAYATCPQCGELMRSHCACLSCGQYRGRQVLKVAKDDAE